MDHVRTDSQTSGAVPKRKVVDPIISLDADSFLVRSFSSNHSLLIVSTLLLVPVVVRFWILRLAVYSIDLPYGNLFLLRILVIGLAHFLN